MRMQAFKIPLVDLHRLLSLLMLSQEKGEAIGGRDEKMHTRIRTSAVCDRAQVLDDYLGEARGVASRLDRYLGGAV
jgi:hypothetical protein